MRKYDLVKDKVDSRDLMYGKRHVVESEILPKKIDLREKCSPVVDQGQLGSCTANAIVSGLREFMLLNDNRNHFERLSRLFLYWWERDLEGSVYRDSGASLRDGMKVLKNEGVCLEASWPYDIKTFENSPTEKELEEAKNYTISGYQRIKSIDEIKHALLIEHLVVFGITVYESFETVKTDGIVPVPKEGEKELGGHALCIVGYDDNFNNGSFIVRNSWGDSWGDKGYCYIPYSMFEYLMDIWTVKLGA
ncbi:peptidase C1A papain [Clostridium sp. DL-VIII]|uniref:C1 family peptidase n=1 Tax=Clostridium sp. DL-VIII TaxID=641107 RepID=UPI00023AFA6E|nr:C1 family peptidase [Clostridium sp. DL-VIII]EHI99379.1 peptidase C1A papain [Clostridium sp. DL-VIII]